MDRPCQHVAARILNAPSCPECSINLGLPLPGPGQQIEAWTVINHVTGAWVNTCSTEAEAIRFALAYGKEAVVLQPVSIAPLHRMRDALRLVPETDAEQIAQHTEDMAVDLKEIHTAFVTEFQARLLADKAAIDAALQAAKDQDEHSAQRAALAKELNSLWETAARVAQEVADEQLQVFHAKLADAPCSAYTHQTEAHGAKRVAHRLHTIAEQGRRGARPTTQERWLDLRADCRKWVVDLMEQHVDVIRNSGANVPYYVEAFDFALDMLAATTEV